MINGQIDAGDIRNYLMSKVAGFTGDVSHGDTILIHWAATDTPAIQTAVNALIAGSTFAADVAKLAIPARVWTPFQFFQKFTPAETSAILNSTDTTVKTFVLSMQLYQVVYPDDPSCKAGLDYLVSIGILTADRETAILQ